ncbi:MAG TPA: M67 family metallopeptidase [Solirubrobacteraceae bacterium]|nr:M67 family metallopeptidase [Solirubrobacteraceae bacterium]
MKISQQLLDELIAHVLEDPVNEICGVVAVDADGSEPGSARATDLYRAANRHASPMKFEIEPAELLKMYNAIEDRGGRIGAIYHSHVRSRPYPSQTDINFAANWPGVEWIIVGLVDPSRPEIRSYLIDQGQVREVALERQ